MRQRDRRFIVSVWAMMVAISLLGLAVVMLSSCIPSINLSECLEGCSFDSSPCATEVEQCLDECANDIECSKDCAQDLTGCADESANRTLDCFTDCIEEAEDQL